MIERKHIEDALAPALKLIGNADLRTKVIDAWMLAIQEGGWQSIKDLHEMPFTLLTDTRGINFFEHTLAVTMGAVGLAKGQTDCYRKMPYVIDMDRLLAGGLLHDVGKLLECQRNTEGKYVKSHQGECARHPVSGAIIAAKVGLPLEIINIIACHAKEGEGRPQCMETVLIHQADFGTFDPLVMMTKGLLIQ